MSQLVIDMMGSDLGSAMSKEAVQLFHKAHPDCHLILVGKKEELADLQGYEIIDAPDVVKMEMGALEVLRMKDSSMVKAIAAVTEKGADGVVSAGSTGAFLSATTLMLKKIPGVIRPALVTSFPNLKEGGFTTVLDVGASNVNTPEEMAQFALMGSIYAQKVNHIASPRVALLSNGSEEGKGSPEGKAAYELLKKDSRLHFVGNVEGSGLLQGVADVIVTDGYSGNIMLKSVEGAAKGMSGMLKKAFKRNIFSKIGYLLTKKGLKEMKEALDPKKTGGALLLGINGVVVKAHGNSTSEAFKNAMEVAYRLSEAKVVDALKEGFRS
jgi:fatty acid/phospholipid synthesis protein PlsX